MGSNFVQENQPYPPFGRLPRLGRRVLAALAEINPNRHFVALLPRLGRLIPLICFAKGKQANQPSAEEMLFPPGIFILTALLSAAFAAPFLAEAGFKGNKEKISNLICLKPFLIPSLPYAHSYHTPFPSRARSRPASALKSNIPYIFQEKRPSRVFFCGWILALPFIPPFVLAGYPLESGKVYIFCFVSGAGGSWRMWDRF